MNCMVCSYAPGRPARPTPRRGFSLVELLVVIGIIAVLISILVPVVNRVRVQGYQTDTQNLLMVLRNGIEAYHQTFHAYPGPLLDLSIGPVRQVNGTQITGTENLLLGLTGGLEANGNQVFFNPNLIGKGPRSLNSLNPKQYDPFIGDVQKYITQGADCVFTPNDTNIPEFLDRFGEEKMPILYLRAKVGASGIVDDAGQAQYDLRQIQPYTMAPPRYAVDDPPKKPGRGLFDVGNMGDAWDSTRPNQAMAYFRHPSLPDTPRSKDTWILISAGRDRIYGTGDDITSFGTPGE